LSIVILAITERRCIAVGKVPRHVKGIVQVKKVISTIDKSSNKNATFHEEMMQDAWRKKMEHHDPY
jgi:hypothetical protein